MNREETGRALAAALKDHQETGLTSQVNYMKFYEYSIITHSTAIEGSTMTEDENILLFEKGIVSGTHTMTEINMNCDLKDAYEMSYSLAHAHVPYTLRMLSKLSASVLKNTGMLVNAANGTFDSSHGEYRLVNVHPTGNSRSYANYDKVIPMTSELCQEINKDRQALLQSGDNNDLMDIYDLSFKAHYKLVSIHPWLDGNGRMSRLVMNQLQEEFGVLPVKVTSEHKLAYVKSLKGAREDGSMDKFLDFMYGEHIGNVRQELFEYWIEKNPDYKTRKNETVDYALDYIRGDRGIKWLQDSFNETCADTFPETINDDVTAYRKMFADEVINRCTPRTTDEEIAKLRDDINTIALAEGNVQSVKR